ncbi:MAG: GNAT family N-acetyltransferase [bacterium]
MSQILDFTRDYILENEYVQIAPVDDDSGKLLYEVSQEKEIWTYFLESDRGDGDLEKYFQSTLIKRIAKKEYAFVFYDKIKNAYAGTTRFYDYNPVLKTIKLGHTWIGQNFQGTLLNKYIKYLLFQFVFEELALERIGFGVHGENKRSLAAMTSVGCIKEGVLRSFLPSINQEERTDIILFSITKKDWFENVKSTLNHKLKYKL